MKKVSCANCGFLHWAISDARDEFGATIRRTELIEYWRSRLLGGGHFDGSSQENEDVFTISCLRNQWIFSKSIPSSNKDVRYADTKALSSIRKCLYFMRYEPGFGPEEHKDIQARAQDRGALFKATLIGAIIGAIAAIAAQLIYAIVTRS